MKFRNYGLGTISAALTAAITLLAPNAAVAQTAPVPGSPDFLLTSTDTLIGVANTKTPVEALAGLDRALDQLALNMARHGDRPGAVRAEADAFGSLISGMAQMVADGGDPQLQALVAAASQRHIDQLESLRATLPDAAQSGISKAIASSRRGQQMAISALRGEVGGRGMGRPGGVGRPGGAGMSGFGGMGGGMGQGMGGGMGGGPPAGVGKGKGPR